jgi:hydrophobic/amphiphilic exporter-1 (mainly G- bacteria), HAE1 family
MGAAPIALGFGADETSRRPLGLILVGGLVVSQLITLYVTPAIYLYMEDLQGRLNRLYDKLRSRAPRDSEAAGSA